MKTKKHLLEKKNKEIEELKDRLETEIVALMHNSNSYIDDIINKINCIVKKTKKNKEIDELESKIATLLRNVDNYIEDINKTKNRVVKKLKEYKDFL